MKRIMPQNLAKLDGEFVFAARAGVKRGKATGASRKRSVRVPNIAARLKAHPYSDKAGQAVIDSILREAVF